MLGSGKSSGVVNEASNLKANQNLTSAIEEMNTKEYIRNRDLNDVVPTHRRQVEAMMNKGNNNNGKVGLPAYDPATEKEKERKERGQTHIEDRNDSDDDGELEELRKRRMAQMQQHHAKVAEWRQKQHGQYREISQDEFFSIVVREKGGSDDVCVHFYHKDFETCRVMDSRLLELSRMMLSVKFVKIDAEKSPFLVERLHIKTLPCCVLFHNDVAVDRIYGFEGCIGEDGLLDKELLGERILRAVNCKQEECE
ncbi:hypothetical protein, conserved [Trypanosoma brucei gambiense DAL972]|uniref:Phosducin domain-containing protein n=2 Tax=Trypanosoma brucei TaxID=5691 RepID=C9ZJI5_TRYB9|nr:hypothetical protein, conserved [Trypanosoma brucei gambiense DAL972]RHW73969.1 phosducin [Trypanosoma brucei equiperdum]CBH09544.1 hypothetical protein, conserved [Trypanosoma brucei gambiense DAL972]|eukprot:XP_011771849.1 hypothetical protein, conserved [Trypanosoma brucei gambiense DAL972]